MKNMRKAGFFKESTAFILPGRARMVSINAIGLMYHIEDRLDYRTFTLKVSKTNKLLYRGKISNLKNQNSKT